MFALASESEGEAKFEYDAEAFNNTPLETNLSEKEYEEAASRFNNAKVWPETFAKWSAVLA